MQNFIFVTMSSNLAIFGSILFFFLFRLVIFCCRDTRAVEDNLIVIAWLPSWITIKRLDNVLMLGRASDTKVMPTGTLKLHTDKVS